MRNYLKAFVEAFGSGLVKSDTIKKHIEHQTHIDHLIPDPASFSYILEMPAHQYHFVGAQQEALLGYRNEEMLNGGIAFFLERLHPEEIEIFLNQLYPETMDFIADTVKEDFDKAIGQYNFRFRKKSGEFVNLIDQVCFLETDANYKPTLVLGHVISIDTDDILPLRASIRLSKKNNVIETLLSKNYTKPSPLMEKITTREMDILRNLATGKTSKEIAEALYISPHTVDTHRRNLLAKLNCKSVVELTRIAFNNGLF